MENQDPIEQHHLDPLERLRAALSENWNEPVRLIGRKRWISIDAEFLPGQWTGRLIIDRLTRQVYGIKAYGVPNRKKFAGTVELLAAQFEAANESYERKENQRRKNDLRL